MNRLRAGFAEIRRTLHRLAGMPDYAGYLEHQRRCHPDRPPLTEREFFEEYLRTRYDPARSRCC